MDDAFDEVFEDFENNELDLSLKHVKNYQAMIDIVKRIVKPATFTPSTLFALFMEKLPAIVDEVRREDSVS